MANQLQRAIVLTIAYSNQFQYPLTPSEVYTRLIWRGRLLPTLTAVAQELLSLLAAGQLEYHQGFVCLPGQSEHVATRLKRTSFAQKQRQEIIPLISFLQHIPWIKGIVITGSLALNAITKADDSDFLLVVKPKRLWITRLLVTFFAWISGKRRSWQRGEDNSWCFNLWLDTTHLSLPAPQRSIYGAFEVLQADWVWGCGVAEQAFYKQNSWVATYLPFFWQKKVAQVSAAPPQVRWELPLLRHFFDALDWLSYILQLWYRGHY